MNQKPFVNLHAHSYYSILESSNAPKDLLNAAKEMGAIATAITDTGVGHGFVDFVESANKVGDIKPILGAEIFVSKDSRFEKRQGLDGNEGYIVLLAQTKVGYENLLKLISLAHLQGYFYKPRVDWELLEAHKEGLICLTGAEGSLIDKALQFEGQNSAKELVDKLKALYTNSFYGELCARNTPEQKNLNEFIVGEGINTVVTSNARFIKPEDEEAADTLYCIGKNQLVSDPSRPKIMSGSWFKNWEAIQMDLIYIDPSILETSRENTLLVADSIGFEMEFDQQLLPYFEVEEGLNQAEQLRKNCEENIPLRYKTSEDQKAAKERLDYELSIISKMGFDSYFLIVADFIDFARNNGISVGPGRGSAAGSIVSFLLGITNIDPIYYELLFERFLNPERISMPDIDIDFSDERRDEVLQYVIEKYGIEKVSKVCTFGTLAAKAALKDVGRARGIPFAEMNAMTKLLPNKPGFSLSDAEEVKDFTDLLDKNLGLQKVFEVSRKLEGCVRHVSVHACAVIIGQSDLSEHTPIQWAPGAEEIKITQFPYQQLEHLGLLKMDFLGLKNLTVLERAILNIEKSIGNKLDLNDIPLNDKKTFEMLSEGETTGVFQFESAGMRRYLKELKPTELEDLVAMNALYRPGPMEYIPQYIKGKHDPKTVKYMHKDLEMILKKTYGIAVYQEQVLRIAQEFAGFSLGEADILRKAIGKKIASILAEQRAKFIDGAVKKGYDKKLATKIFDDIVVPFSGYGFNRSHAVCYARIAYETAYLRANYPVEFMAAMMTADRNNTDRIVLEMNECQSMGIEVLPPSVNESGSHFTVITESNEVLPLENDEKSLSKIRFGLTAIKGLGEDTVDIIIFERNQNGKYKNLQDFAKRVPAKVMNKKTLEALAFSGALDAFGNRGAIVDSLDELAKFARDYQHKESAGQMGLFGGVDEAAIEFSLKETVATKEDILAWERESLGLFVSDHPLKGLNDYFEKYGTLIGRLNESEDKGQRRTIHGLVIKCRKIITKRGKNMAILELEDTSGKIECAIFPNAYDKIPAQALNEDAFLRVRGKVEARDGQLNCIVDEIKVGNLKDIQNSTAMFANEKKPKEEKVVPPPTQITKDIYEIVVPENTSKEIVNRLKILLFESKAEGESGTSVTVAFKGKTVEIPFKIKHTASLEEKINTLLRPEEIHF